MLNLGERLRNSMAENKNLQASYAKLQEECERLKSENGIYCEPLQGFWTLSLSDGSLTKEQNVGPRGW